LIGKAKKDGGKEGKQGKNAGVKDKVRDHKHKRDLQVAEPFHKVCPKSPLGSTLPIQRAMS
jgi:hypothetical protein